MLNTSGSSPLQPRLSQYLDFLWEFSVKNLCCTLWFSSDPTLQNLVESTIQLKEDIAPVK